MSNHNATPAFAPSRHDNPFATCWTRPGTLAFRFVDGRTIEQLIAKLAAQGWWGEIVGPHGSGKSTLLETLKPALAAAGHSVQAIALRDGPSKLPSGFLRAAHAKGMARAICGHRRGLTPGIQNSFLEPATIIIDGYEQLSRLQRWRLRRHCRCTGAGLIVTSHAPTGLPELIRLAPDRRLIEELVGDLCSKVSRGVTAAELAASHDCHGSNLREVFFDLYDRHEQWRRIPRTVVRDDA